MKLFEKLAAAAYAALAAYAAVDAARLSPVSLDAVPLCLFHTVTGIDCPGCGMTRALVAAFQGRFADAAHFHALSLPLIGVWTAWLGWGVANHLRGRDFTAGWPDLLAGHRGWAALSVVLGVWLIRLS